MNSTTSKRRYYAVRGLIDQGASDTRIAELTGIAFDDVAMIRTGLIRPGDEIHLTGCLMLARSMFHMERDAAQDGKSRAVNQLAARSQAAKKSWRTRKAMASARAARDGAA